MVSKGDARAVSSALETLAEDWNDFEPITTALEAEGKATVDGFEITKEVLTWTKNQKKVHEQKFTPSVIEPSFGMGSHFVFPFGTLFPPA
jgi:glycyl-tRNA synthetase